MKVISNNERVFGSLLTVICALLLSPSNAGAAQWQIDVVDQSGAAEFTSLRADAFGNIHVAYVADADGHPLKYAFWDHASKRWFTMKVAQYASFCTLALDSKQHPHISFADHGTGLGATLRHAYWDGSEWHVVPITIQAGAVVAYYTSVALDKNDNPFFSYYDYADPGNNFRLRMRSVLWIGDHWEARTVDAQGGSGKFNAIAIDSNGRPHIAYANVKYESSGLRYASWNGNEWQTEIIEGATGPCPVFSVGMVLDSKDNPHIAYSLTESRQVKYAVRMAGQWQTQVIDKVGQVAYPDRNGISLDHDGNPYLSYYDAGAGVLKVAHRENNQWLGETVDSNLSGFTNSLAIDHDILWVSYADQSARALKVAHRPLQASLTSAASAKPAVK
jgi:hypothetical protein